jgi:hypothetical protein
MVIPRTQLETWANQGATTTAQATHVSIRYALAAVGTSAVGARNIDIFLQGSYRNFTNIYSDSDVDVVVLLNETYTRDTARLSGWEQQAEARAAARHPVEYAWEQFKRDMIASLRVHYGAASVIEGGKAVKVLAGNGRLAADVLPAIGHRLYTSYGTTLLTPTNYLEGISFWDRAGRQVVNYPKQHIANGQTKNARTYDSYKPTVRMFKNARRYLVTKGRLGDGIAPSYFVECLLYNVVPDGLFTNDRQETMHGVLGWLLGSDISQFWCQNGQVPLFGVTPEQWSEVYARRLIDAMAKMWGQWPI